MKIKEYFLDFETDCQCGCGTKTPLRGIELLYSLRLIINKPLIIKSGVRCVKHNARVGGKEYSAHLPWRLRNGLPESCAFDILVKPEDEYKIIRIAQAIGFTGIGINNNKFIHIDTAHEAPTIWTYPI